MSLVFSVCGLELFPGVIVQCAILYRITLEVFSGEKICLIFVPSCPENASIFSTFLMSVVKFWISRDRFLFNFVCQTGC